MSTTAEQYAAAAEASYLRACRLHRMSYAELRTLLSGEQSEAVIWIESAARHGVAAAQTRLGRMLLEGQGIARDEQAAIRWFQKAAAQKDADAMNMVGRCHENGWGTSKDLLSAARWYKLSADGGHDWGMYNYAHMLFDGCGGEPYDRTLAFIWYLRAAERGHTRAMNLVGRCYEAEWGVERDMPRASAWYQRSAVGGYFRGQFNYASVLAANGDIANAVSWFEQACRAANEDSAAPLIATLIRHQNRAVSELGLRLKREFADRCQPDFEKTPA